MKFGIDIGDYEEFVIGVELFELLRPLLILELELEVLLVLLSLFDELLFVVWLSLVLLLVLLFVMF
jgi:hypothetical protein